MAMRLGIIFTLVLFLVMVPFAGLPIAAVIAGFLGGATQPLLFKNLKYR
jgi:hypothetical protein